MKRNKDHNIMHGEKISKAKDLGVRFAEAEGAYDLEKRIEEILEELGDREVKEIQYKPMVHDLSTNYKARSISHYTAMIIYEKEGLQKRGVV